jgi:hypothetical protein
MELDLNCEIMHQEGNVQLWGPVGRRVFSPGGNHLGHNNAFTVWTVITLPYFTENENKTFVFSGLQFHMHMVGLNLIMMCTVHAVHKESTNLSCPALPHPFTDFTCFSVPSIVNTPEVCISN